MGRAIKPNPDDPTATPPPCFWRLDRNDQLVMGEEFNYIAAVLPKRDPWGIKSPKEMVS